MHIVHLIENMYPEHGGPPAIVSRLAAAQVRLGHDVTILTTYESSEAAANIAKVFGRIPRFRSVSRHSVGAQSIPARLGLVAHKRLARHLDGADVVHIHALWDPLLMRAMRYCRRGGIPLCVTPHGLLNRFSMSNKTWKKRLALSIAWSKAINAANVLHCLTGDEGNDVRALGFTAPVVVLPNGVDADEFAGESAGVDVSKTVATVLPPHASSRFVLFLGRLHATKGLDILCDAFATVAGTHPHIDLVIAGPDGGYESTLRNHIARLGLSARIHIVGSVFGSAKAALLGSALCLCQPSRQEGFSITILEALACGVPAVISTECHFPEVQSAGAGYVASLNAISTAKALLQLLGDENARRAAGKAARQLVLARYTVDRMAAHLVESYLAIGAGAPTRVALG